MYVQGMGLLLLGFFGRVHSYFILCYFIITIIIIILEIGCLNLDSHILGTT